MRLNFLQLSPEDRGEYFIQASQQRGLSPVILEKDFWVCWMLGVLFRSPFAEHLVFKGGTSLSKVFGAIERFSEDIDLSLSPEFLGLADVGNELPSSRTRANNWMQDAQSRCAEAVEKQLLPELQRWVSDGVGDDVRRLEYQFDMRAKSPVLLFRYPSKQPDGFHYLPRVVKLEFGSLTDQRPTGSHPIRPWVADHFPKEFEDWRCDVVSLELERTFWEKVLILHCEAHRPPGSDIPDRFSRHYADTAALSEHPRVVGALSQPEIRDRVVAWKSLYFGNAWGRFDLARPGSFELVPHSSHESALRSDYAKMKDMYLSEPPSFDVILSALQALQKEINR